MSFNRIQAAEVKLWDFSAYFWNTPRTATFHSFKKDNVQMKNCDVFLIFAQNIDFGYTLEPPH